MKQLNCHLNKKALLIELGGLLVAYEAISFVYA